MQTREEKANQTKIKENIKEEKENMRKTKQGISLIVLVITIIVMIILASAVIISLSNNGIINRANEAVNKANLSEVQHLASLAWSEAYLDAMADKTLTEDERQANIKAAVEKAFEDNKLNVDDYELTYGAGGVTVALKTATKWELVRTTDANGKVTKVVVTDGTNEIEVGSTINYMIEGVGPENAKYTGPWKLLGVDAEGKLLIVSTADAGITGSNLIIGDNNSLELCKTSMAEAIKKLNNIANNYIDGEIGISARSITIEDVNNITGYLPEAYTTERFMTSMFAPDDKSPEVKPFGKEVTYSWNNSSIGYSWKNGDDTITGNLVSSHEQFTYYDEITDTFITKLSASSGQIGKIKHTSYRYEGIDKMNNNILAYKMLFRNTADTDYTSYWLASRLAYLSADYAAFGIRYVGDFEVVTELPTLFSYGEYYATERPVRAVVTLAPGVSLTESTTTAGTYDLSI